MVDRASLRDKLAGPQALGALGVHDGLSARLLEHVGGTTAFLSGAGISFARFGKPDLGFLNVSDLAEVVCNIADCAPGLDLIVDIDTGFGNAINAAHAVRVLERAGANALQMEDQTFPKRCGHLAGKSVIDVGEMAGKIRAACEARTTPDLLIFARTDAIGVSGLADAITRGEAYLEAGADALFFEAPKTQADMETIAQHFGGRVPLIHNLVEGGNTPVTSLTELSEIGYRLGLFPLLSLHAAVPAQISMLEHVIATGASTSYAGPIARLQDLNIYVGLKDALETGVKFGTDSEKPIDETKV
jgi:2-methylisocitrate lyase-like PEP mutase family enzyme